MPTTPGRWVSPSPISAGLRCRCPRCGEGPVFDGYLTIARRCRVCGLELGRNDSADGPAVFLIFVIGTIGVIAALVVELSFAVPVWAPVAIASGIVAVLVLVLLRPAKAYVVALQFHHRRDDFERPRDPTPDPD